MSLKLQLVRGGEVILEVPLSPLDWPKEQLEIEFEAFEDPQKTSQYTIVRRDENGQLQTIPYHIAFDNHRLAVRWLLIQGRF